MFLSVLIFFELPAIFLVMLTGMEIEGADGGGREGRQFTPYLLTLSCLSCFLILWYFSVSLPSVWRGKPILFLVSTGIQIWFGSQTTMLKTHIWFFSYRLFAIVQNILNKLTSYNNNKLPEWCLVSPPHILHLGELVHVKKSFLNQASNCNKKWSLSLFNPSPSKGTDIYLDHCHQCHDGYKIIPHLNGNPTFLEKVPPPHLYSGEFF